MKIKFKIFTGIILSILFLGGAVFSYCSGLFGHHLILVRTNFKHLPSWEKDQHQEALATFQRSCTAIVKLNPNKTFSTAIPQGGKVKDWQKICSAIEDPKTYSNSKAKKFFEFWFEPYQVRNNFNSYGLFTGYYLPKLRCSLKRGGNYLFPIYSIPNDLIKVNLGLFDRSLANRTIVGQLQPDGQLRPYPNRADIVNGMIHNTAKVIAWCDDQIALALAHIQGSAVVQLPNNREFLINYAISNGRSYTSYGGILIKNKQLTSQNCSMQEIYSWLLRHPEKMDSILNKNASYVFFRILSNLDPLGSEQVSLTPKRSLAVDRRYIPLGSPIWIDTVIPSKSESLTPFCRLLIAQDTGGAIKGIIRGDVYWGSGDYAAFVAGHMKSPGKYWILLPRLK
ncbi:MAG: MltA domain-containing protein [Coxiellaceae bacterium]|jgi:membrane-bound lytic murein transglycosylase A|nr:MltA domain-containing protein [Coxiellaceae bacterium]